MLRKLAILALVLAVGGFAVFWFITTPATVSADALGPHTPNLENGRTLFFAGGCASCHATPNQDDRTRLGGGLGLKSPFGTFYVPNISPDANDGLGRWTEAQFVTAMVKGTSPAGEHYYPSFPYTSYQRIRTGDLRDLFAHLKTLPAVQGRARGHDLPFPFNIRRTLGGWKFLYVDGKPFQPDPAKSPEWNRGAYLVNGPGHCAECHSERNAAGAIIEDRRFAGGPDPEGRGTVPNITPHPSGIGGWTADDLTTLLKTGETPNFDTVGGPMGAVVANTAQLPDADRWAMAEYLLSLPPRQGFKKPE